MNNLEQGKISSIELIYLLFAFFMGSTTLLPPGGGAGNNAWLVIPAGMAAGLIFAWIHISLIQKYPGKTLVEINNAVYGPYLGRIFSVFYILFFLQIAGVVVAEFSAFFSLIMPETPFAVFSFFILLVCAWGVKCGLEVIARASIIIVPIIVIILIFDTVFVSPQMDFSNLLPILDISALQFFKASLYAAAYPFGEAVIFLVIYPFLNKPGKIGSSVLQAFFITGLALFVSAIRNVTVLGPTGQDFVFANFHLVRMIDIGDILTRGDIVVAVSLMAVGFIKAAIFYYCPVVGMAQVLNMKSYQPLVLPMGALILNLSLISFDNFPSFIRNAMEIYPFYSMPFIFFLPFITLIIAYLRRNQSENKQDQLSG